MKNKVLRVLPGILLLCLLIVMIATTDWQSALGLATFAPLTWSIGNDNMGGFKGRLAFIPETDIDTWPSLKTTKTTSADYVTTDGTLAIKTGAAAIPIYATRGTVGYKAEIQGDPDCQSFAQTLEFFHPGSQVDAAAFARQVCNTPGVIIFEDDENQYVMGQKGRPCSISPSFDGGKAAADKRGYSYTASADSVCPLIVMGTKFDIDALFTTTV